MNLLTPVSQFMSTELVTITVHTPLAEVGSLMRKHEIHHLPVVDPKGNLVGMLSIVDFLKILSGGLEGQSVDTLMTKGLAKLEPGDTLRTAASLFALNKFHSLPVVEGAKLVGIVTTLDVIRLVDELEVKASDYGKSNL